MIKVKVKRAEDGFIVGFKVNGHAGFAEHGEDIICSAVSAVVLTAVGYAEQLYNPKDEATLRCFTQESGLTAWHCPENITVEVRKKLETVMDTMVYGLKQISESYGNKYLVVFD